MFAETAPLVPQKWIEMWTQEIPSGNESILFLEKSDIPKQLLINNNIFFVAERSIEGRKFFYGHANLEDGSIFLIEIKIDGSQLQVTTKTFCMHLIDLFQECIKELLLQQ